jgi:hypothetical protein
MPEKSYDQIILEYYKWEIERCGNYTKEEKTCLNDVREMFELTKQHHKNLGLSEAAIYGIDTMIKDAVAKLKK